MNRLEQILAREHIYPTYKSVTITIDTGCKWETGWNGVNKEQKMQSLTELSSIFWSAGYRILISDDIDMSDTAVKGKERMYLHPIIMQGELLPETIHSIIRKLKSAKHIKFVDVNILQDVYDINDATIDWLLTQYESEIYQDIFNAFQDKQFESILFSEIYSDYYVNRVNSLQYMSVENFEYKKIEQIFHKLVNEGKIQETITRSRWNDKIKTYQTVKAEVEKLC